jgi:2-polyprenyl-3-methyl-5-hydroxy-6-metoxy-1,4-benzoquinol methylase
MLTDERHITPEIMDGPNVEAAAHARALRGLRRINAASHAAEALATPIIEYARRKNLSNISLLDIACGGGDVPIGVAGLLQRSGIEVNLTLLDRSSTALNLAADAAAAAGIPCRTIQADLTQALNPGQFDIVTCTLFLHHISDPDQVVELLKQMREISRHLIVISDLRRGPLGLLIAWAGSRILSRSGIVHHDAPASVRAAWTIQELAEFARRADLTAARVQPCWPWRMLLTWQSQGQAQGESA